MSISRAIIGPPVLFLGRWVLFINQELGRIVIFMFKGFIMIFSLIIATVSLLIFSFSYNALLLFISISCFGFGLMGSGPITLEYAVDATTPVPEASSNGILMMGGAIGGIILIVGLENVKFSGDYFPALIIQTVLLALCVVLSLFLKEFKVANEHL